MKVILCGYNWAGCKALELLLKNKNEIFVYTSESPAHISDMQAYCQKQNIPFSTEKISQENLPWTPDIICSIYYRHIIPNNVISLCNNKIFNLHPSLLPEYKGCSSLTWAMINGEKKVGYSYHYIDKDIDTGAIILQNEIPVEDFDLQVSLYYRVMFESLKHFNTVFDLVKKGESGKKQKKGGHYFKRGCPLNGTINPQWTENQIERFIRAMTFPPLPYANFQGHEIKTYDNYLQILKNENINLHS